MEFTLLFAALTGVGCAWIGVRIQRRRGLLSEVDKPADVLIGGIGVGVIVGRLVSMALSGVNPITNPADILLVRGGVDTAAASAAALATVVWALRDQPTALDALAPAALAGLAGWHAGCVWTGTCLGSATGGDWGLTLPGSDVGRHPTEIYAAVILLAGALAVGRLRAPLRATGAAIAIAGLARLATEPIRPSISGGPVVWYGAAIGAGVIVVVAGPRLLERSPLSRGP